MKKTLILFLKGMIVGIGQIIPGVSGGMLAITLGIYEKGIEIISDIFKSFKENIHFILTVGFGILISIIFCSKLIKYFLIKFYFPTMLLFIGLIIGGIPSLINKIKSFKKNNIKNVLIAVITFFIFSFLALINFSSKNNYFGTIGFIIIGFIYASAMVIPGVSGTALMMLIGCYEIIINMISNLTNISVTISNFKIIIPFGIGLVLGIIHVSKFMNYMIKNHEIKTHYFIIGLVISSIFIMFIQSFNTNINFTSFLIGLILLIIGFKISTCFDS